MAFGYRPSVKIHTVLSKGARKMHPPRLKTNWRWNLATAQVWRSALFYKAAHGNALTYLNNQLVGEFVYRPCAEIHTVLPNDARQRPRLVGKPTGGGIWLPPKCANSHYSIKRLETNATTYLGNQLAGAFVYLQVWKSKLFYKVAISNAFA